jgi:hypothetical protein
MGKDKVGHVDKKKAQLTKKEKRQKKREKKQTKKTGLI